MSGWGWLHRWMAALLDAGCFLGIESISEDSQLVGSLSSRHARSSSVDLEILDPRRWNG